MSSRPEDLNAKSAGASPEPNWSLVLLGWVAAIVVVTAGHLIATSAMRPYFDFDLHYLAGKLERQGGFFLDNAAVQDTARRLNLPVSAEGVYGTPALIALVFVPLSFLSVPDAHLAWSIICIAAVAISIRKAISDSSRWPIWLFLAAMGPALIQSQSLGNPSTLTFALVVFAFGALRLHQSSQAGVALGMAIAFKAYPAFALVALIAKSDWQAVKTAVATCTVVYALTAIVLGPRHLYDGVKHLLEVGGEVHTWMDNASIPGLVVQTWDLQVVAQWTSRVLLIVFAIGIVLLCRRLPPHVTFAIAAMTMLLAQSISWRNYFAITIIGLLALRDLRPTLWHWGVGIAAYLASTGWHRFFDTSLDDHTATNLFYIIGTAVLTGVVFHAASTMRTIAPTTPLSSTPESTHVS